MCALVGFRHLCKQILGVTGKEFPIRFPFVRQFKKEFSALIVSFEEGFDENIPLGQEKAVFSRVTGGRRGLYAVGPVYEGGHRFV